MKLDAPGTDDQLRELTGRLFTPLLDRSKPLWETYVVDGLAGGRSAIICKIHHSIVDGVAGIGLLNIILDATPEVRRLPRRKPYNPPPAPDPATLFLDALGDTLSEIPQRFDHGKDVGSKRSGVSDWRVRRSVSTRMRRADEGARASRSSARRSASSSWLPLPSLGSNDWRRAIASETERAAPKGSEPLFKAPLLAINFADDLIRHPRRRVACKHELAHTKCRLYRAPSIPRPTRSASSPSRPA